MKCEFDYCIYNKERKCIIRMPSINSLGMCEECIIVSIDRDYLEKEKKRQLKIIEDIYD